MPLIDRGYFRREYEQHHRDGMYLGRHMELDSRSLRYTVEEASRIVPHEWLPSIPTLDQGNTGSCTGNAGTYALSNLYASDLASIELEGHKLSDDPLGNEDFARDLYHLATVADGFPGVYPPDDTGSSGLAICRVAKAQKLVHSYVWATTLRGFASLLQRGGCIIGTPWYEAWFQPDAHGFIDSDAHWLASGVAGGHEVYIEALETWVDKDPEQSIIRFHNSWADSWGDHGCGRMRLSTYLMLNREIDVKALHRA